MEDYFEFDESGKVLEWVSENCPSHVEIPNTVTEIGSYAFEGCTSLQSVEIPDSVTKIGDDVFSRCSSLPKISVSRKSSCFVSVDGVLYDIDKTRLIQYPAGRNEKAFSIPDTVTEIGGSAFEGCTSLQSIDIPGSVTKIGNGAFSGCI